MHYIKILFLTNNEQSFDLFNWISADEEVQCRLFQERINLDYLNEFEPDLIISFGYRFIIKEDVIKSYQGKIINLHISYLPWNKGADPNVWSFLENTPKGVTIHYIDEGIDTGDILFQMKVDFNEQKETLSSSYTKLQNEIMMLFKENWDSIKRLNFYPQKQVGEGSIHFIKDWEKISFLIDEKGWETPIIELKEKYEEYLLSNENT